MSDRPRVVHIVTKFDLGGAQETVWSLCAGLSPEFECWVIGGRPEPGDTDIRAARPALERVEELDSLVRPISPLRDLLALAALVRRFRELRPAVVHTHSSKAGLLGRFAARVADVPVLIHHVHGWSFHDAMPRMVRAVYVAAERVAARWTDAFVVVANADAEKGEAKRIAPRAKYVLIRSAIDLARFGTSRPTTHRRGDRHVIGTVGRLSEQKDPATLLAAMKRVVQRVPDATLRVAGDGPLRRHVERLIVDYGLGQHVELHGSVEDVVPFLHSLDVFVLTSKWEGLPRSLIEAMTAGVPVIATPVGGVTEVVVDGVSGILVPVGDWRATGDAIVRLLSGPDLRRSLSAAGRKVANDFDQREMVANVATLYRRLITGS